MSGEITKQPESPGPQVLDHASEFVELVSARAPLRYRQLRAQPRMQRLLERENTFNHGKLFAYAEFLVFRDEFLARFPNATPHACINAFSKLFLKNDISISNLVQTLEATTQRDRQYLEGRRNPAQDADDP